VHILGFLRAKQVVSSGATDYFEHNSAAKMDRGLQPDNTPVLTIVEMRQCDIDMECDLQLDFGEHINLTPFTPEDASYPAPSVCPAVSTPEALVPAVEEDEMAHSLKSHGSSLKDTSSRDCSSDRDMQITPSLFDILDFELNLFT